MLISPVGYLSLLLMSPDISVQQTYKVSFIARRNINTLLHFLELIFVELNFYLKTIKAALRLVYLGITKIHQLPFVSDVVKKH